MADADTASVSVSDDAASRSAGERGIEISGLAKRFGAITAVDGVDLAVAPGELVALLGPNGSGKTTVLRCAAGSVRPDAGAVRVGGHDVVTDRRGASRLTGSMMSEGHDWYRRLSGAANLEFYAGVRGLDARRARREAWLQLEQVGLVEAAERPVDEYSRGMRARLALARARLGEPRALLLDEPSATLDARSTVDLHRHLAGERDRSVLLATHDVSEAVALADRALLLRHGRAVEQLQAPLTVDQLTRAVERWT